MRFAALCILLCACSSSSSADSANGDPCATIDTPPGCEACWDHPADACMWDGGAPAPASICCYSLNSSDAGHCASTAGKTLATVCR